MPPLSLPALPSGQPTAWEEAIYAFLVEKRSRSGSTRTVESYARMLWPFLAAKTPDQVRSADVLAYAHGIGLSGRTPSFATVGARIACLSSVYRFTIRMGLLTANPCDALERPRIATRCRDRAPRTCWPRSDIAARSAPPGRRPGVPSSSGRPGTARGPRTRGRLTRPVVS